MILCPRKAAWQLLFLFDRSGERGGLELHDCEAGDLLEVAKVERSH